MDTPIALITGAAGDIGQACCNELANRGYQICATDINGQKLEKACRNSNPTRYQSWIRNNMDVSEEKSVQEIFRQIEQSVGQVRALICCAGIMPGAANAKGTITDLTLADWELANAVNLKGTFLCIREFLRWRKVTRVDHGRIITFSSAAAQLGGYRGDASYIASKAGILGLTKLVARETATMAITANCIAAGPVKTAMFDNVMTPEAIPPLTEKIPTGKIGMPSHVAAALGYLVSEDADWVTGSTLDVNGGYRMQ